VAFGKSLDFQGGEYGIAIMSRWPISSDTTFHLPVEPPQERSGGSYEPRAALRVILATPHGPLAVVNTHLDPSGDDKWRRQEIRTVLAIVDSLRRRGVPTLAGGDLNSTPESATQETVRSAGLRDAWTTCGQGDGLTYPAGFVGEAHRLPLPHGLGSMPRGGRRAHRGVGSSTRVSDRPLVDAVLL
jgi:endonuclease/exonuclease/phosphatase (EEP) superfamily protein YafD